MFKNYSIHARVPFRKLDLYMESEAFHKINIELYISSNDLDNASTDEFRKWGRIFKDKKIGLSIHAPFSDLSPGGMDSKVRQASLERLIQLLDVAKILSPEVIVVHPGFDHWRNQYNLNQWLSNSCSFWEEILKYTENSNYRFALENVFEQAPDTLLKLIENIGSPRFGFCFDTGHFNLFSKSPLEEWFKQLGPYFFETHLHDNKGEEDSHFPIGEGTFPFLLFFQLLSNIKNQPVLTFETHSREGVLTSIEFFKKYFLLEKDSS